MSEMESSENKSSRAAKAVYRRTSRRGLLAKAGAAVVAVGLGEAAFASSAEAAPVCCSGGQCASCPGTCPGTLSCPSGWSYTGYRWECCYSSRTYYCRDCRNSSGTICVCACRTNYPCAAPGLTATELSAPRR